MLGIGRSPIHPIERYARQFAEDYGPPQTRHDRTQLLVKAGIADAVSQFAAGGQRLLEIGAYEGWQTVAYRDRMNPTGQATIYDWEDFRSQKVKQETVFFCVDLETDRFPEEGGRYDVVICNQVFEHLKNIYLPLSEILRILRPGGHLFLSVPNLSALHNCMLLALGRQPTTLAVQASHVRGFSIWSMTEFMARNGHFRQVSLQGFGLHPFTSARLPGLLRTYCHTPLWVLQKQESAKPIWSEERARTFTTTKFHS